MLYMSCAVYTCTAENGVGKDAVSTATLRVLCEMRIARDSFSFVEDGVPVLDSSPQQGELHFQVLTTDTPHTASFLYLGTDSTGAGYPPTSGFLSATCAQTSVAYKSRCVLTASNVTQQWIGYYNVTIATSTQTVSFTFRLQMKRAKPSDNSIHDERAVPVEPSLETEMSACATSETEGVYEIPVRRPAPAAAARRK
ncbi:hypothetical protein ACOMHN_064222 [Nucella lapillus]